MKSKLFWKARDKENAKHPNFSVTDSFGDGWEACKQEVLKILKQDWTGLDMSINSCDSYYIEKIEKL